MGVSGLMAEVTDLFHDQVNGWLTALNGGAAGTEGFLDEKGTAVIAQEDGESLILRLADGMLGFYVLLFEVPEEKAQEFFQVALSFNLYPTLVGTGNLGYDEATRALTFCAQMPMELMNEELFGRMVTGVFSTSADVRDQFFTMAGILPQEAV